MPALERPEPADCRHRYCHVEDVEVGMFGTKRATVCNTCKAHVFYNGPLNTALDAIQLDILNGRA